MKLNIGLVIDGGVLQSVIIPESDAKGIELNVMLVDFDNDLEDGDTLRPGYELSVDIVPDKAWSSFFIDGETEEYPDPIES